MTWRRTHAANHAITLIGPHDDEPACVLTFEYFFESGDTSALLNRLEKERRRLKITFRHWFMPGLICGRSG